MTHWDDGRRGAACGAVLLGDAKLSPSMSEPTCPTCRDRVQDALDRIIEFGPTGTLPGRPLPPLPGPPRDAPGVVSGLISRAR